MVRNFALKTIHLNLNSKKGNLIHFTKLGSKNELNKGFTNLYLKKKNASCTTLIYRDRDSTQHEISLLTDGITKYGSV
jgi:hypothetical protein